MDEDTLFLSELRWARIRVKRDGSVFPKVTVVTVGDHSFGGRYSLGLLILGLRGHRKKQEVPWEKTKFSHALKRA